MKSKWVGASSVIWLLLAEGRSAAEDESGTRVEIASRPSIRSDNLRFGHVPGTVRAADLVVTEVVPVQLEVGPRFANILFVGPYLSRSVVVEKSRQSFDVNAFTRIGLQLRGTLSVSAFELWAGASIGVALMEADHRISLEGAGRDAKLPGTEGTFEAGASWLLSKSQAVSIGPYFGVAAATFSSERLNGQSFDANITYLGWIGGLRFACALTTDGKARTQ